MSSDIVYLLKFLPKSEYAAELRSHGRMFMRPAGYFGELERGKDSSFTAVCTASDNSRPLYCMTAVSGKDILKMHTGRKAIKLDARCLEDFFKDNTGFAVLIEYKPFLKKIAAFDGCKLHCDKVIYGDNAYEAMGVVEAINSHPRISIKCSDTKRDYQLNVSYPERNYMPQFFVKPSDRAYQKEFRVCSLISLEQLPDVEEQESHFKKYREHLPFKTWRGVSHTADLGSLEDFSRIYSYRDFIPYEENDRFVLLPIE